MKYKTFIKINGFALENEYKFWYPKPLWTLQEYIMREYLDEIKWFDTYRQRKYIEWMEDYLKTNK